mmetsp:Transcript_3894/g.7498  ORF Transcript_3894/g.7498 Transcript_3894/m.7498 type:complete len:93 (+) Transcript_3894:776-1054(+)
MIVSPRWISQFVFCVTNGESRNDNASISLLASAPACLLTERVFDAAFVPNGITMKKHGTRMCIRRGIKQVGDALLVGWLGRGDGGGKHYLFS